MELAKQKEAATTFLRALDKLDPAAFGSLISDKVIQEIIAVLCRARQEHHNN